MTTTTYCRHDLPAHTCADCNPRPQKARPAYAYLISYGPDRHGPCIHTVDCPQVHRPDLTANLERVTLEEIAANPRWWGAPAVGCMICHSHAELT